MPVILTILASKVSWWALTTGTGYLLIQECNIANPLFLESISAGIGFATGEQTKSFCAQFTKTPAMQKTIQCSLAAACLATSYICSNSYISALGFALAQAIGINTALEAVKTYTDSTHTPKQSTTQMEWIPSSWLSNSISKGIQDGIENTLHALCWGSLVSAAPTMSATLLRITLYEHAYRLAKAGCVAAQELLNKA